MKDGRYLMKTDEESLVFGASDVVKSFTITEVGLTYAILVVLPNWTNDVTGVLSIENSDSNEIYASDDLDRNETHMIPTEKPLVGTNTVKLTLFGVPGGSGGTATVTIYIRN